MTFNVAHNYLGMTTEVLRTEKAINDIACHPLPDSFYEGGSLRSLHQRFRDVVVQAPDSGSDHLNDRTSSSPPVFYNDGASSVLSPSRETFAESPTTIAPESPVLTRAFSLRKHQSVQAGDLLTSAGQGNDWYRSYTRTLSIFNPPRTAPPGEILPTGRLPDDEFNLRDEVMACIAKSIGLLQPPISGIPSGVASPAFPPLNTSGSLPGASLLETLSLLDTGEDSASCGTGTSSPGAGYMRGLDNEVEILFFPAGSTLVKTGERNTGRCFVTRRLQEN